MDSRQLGYFVAVCDELHFARAADRLNVAQSAISAQIQRLERELGVRLLHRNKRQPISLTDAGELFYAEAIAALRHMERAEQVGKLAARGGAGVVRLGYVASAATTGLLSEMLAAYRTTHLNVKMEIVAMETPRQLAAVSSGEIDVGIVRRRREYPEGVSAALVHSERLLVAMSENDPLASKNNLLSADLRGQTFIAPQFNEEEGFAETLRALGDVGGFSALAEYKVHDFISAVSLAAAGYGVAIVPESVKQFAQHRCVFRPITDFGEKVHLVLAHRVRLLSPAVREFLQVARQAKRDDDDAKQALR